MRVFIVLLHFNLTAKFVAIFHVCCFLINKKLNEGKNQMENQVKTRIKSTANGASASIFFVNEQTREIPQSALAWSAVLAV